MRGRKMVTLSSLGLILRSICSRGEGENGFFARLDVPKDESPEVVVLFPSLNKPKQASNSKYHKLVNDSKSVKLVWKWDIH